MEIDWKLKLMQILDAVGEAEGVWFDPWYGVTEDEQEKIEEEYKKYISDPDCKQITPYS